eukprot:scpid82070/ scgid8951/ 
MDWLHHTAPAAAAGAGTTMELITSAISSAKTTTPTNKMMFFVRDHLKGSLYKSLMCSNGVDGAGRRGAPPIPAPIAWASSGGKPPNAAMITVYKKGTACLDYSANLKLSKMYVFFASIHCARFLW